MSRLRFVPNQKGIDRIRSLPGMERPLLEAAAAGAKIARENTPKRSGSARRKIDYKVVKTAEGYEGQFGSADIAAHLIEFGGGRSTAFHPVTKAAQELGGPGFHVGRR